MLQTPTSSGERYSVAIICFIPDYGHLQPLLKIADALQEDGIQIKCYIADECRPLMQRFKFDFFALDNTVGLKKEKEMARAFSRSTFFNSVCLYLHYLDVSAGCSHGGQIGFTFETRTWQAAAQSYNL